jgi:hypothetical protein
VWEILRQISFTRKRSTTSSTGLILWSVRGLVRNRNGLSDTLVEKAFKDPALIPTSSWLDTTPGSAPHLSVQAASGGGLRISWSPKGTEPVRLWVLQLRRNNLWTTRILPANTQAALLKQGPYPEIVAVRAVDRFSNLSVAAGLKK